jgi:hypothetical protein
MALGGPHLQDVEMHALGTAVSIGADILCCLTYDISKVDARFDGIWAQGHHHRKLLLCGKETLHCSHPASAVNWKK